MCSSQIVVGVTVIIAILAVSWNLSPLASGDSYLGYNSTQITPDFGCFYRARSVTEFMVCVDRLDRTFITDATIYERLMNLTVDHHLQAASNINADEKQLACLVHVIRTLTPCYIDHTDIWLCITSNIHTALTGCHSPDNATTIDAITANIIRSITPENG